MVLQWNPINKTTNGTCWKWSKYSEFPIIRPPMVLVKSGLNNEQVSLMRSISHWKMNFGTETSGLKIKVSVFLISNGLYSGTIDIFFYILLLDPGRSIYISRWWKIGLSFSRLRYAKLLLHVLWFLNMNIKIMSPVFGRTTFSSSVVQSPFVIKFIIKMGRLKGPWK